MVKCKSYKWYIKMTVENNENLTKVRNIIIDLIFNQYQY